MVMSKKRPVFGVVENIEENKDYTGLVTDTAKVTVNNVSREISVDVDFSNMLGETNKTAYPGDLGAQTRRLVVKNIDDLSKEIERATDKERQIERSIEEAQAALRVSDQLIKNDIKEEENRALAAEAELKHFVESEDYKLFEKLTYAEETINNSIDDLRTEVQEDVKSAIQSLELSDEQIVSSFENSVQELNSELTEIKDDYASKVYVYEQLVEFTKLSKQLADSVDLEDNTVIIKGSPVAPIDGVIYLVKDFTASVEDIYKEYTLIEGVLTLIGDTSTNLEGYATEEFVSEKIGDIDLSPYAKTTDIPTKLSQLNNDADYAKKTDIPDVSEFITAIPSEYITETELADKGYYTLNMIKELLNNIEFIDGGNAPL